MSYNFSRRPALNLSLHTGSGSPDVSSQSTPSFSVFVSICSYKFVRLFFCSPIQLKALLGYNKDYFPLHCATMHCTHTHTQGVLNKYVFT